jgi:glycosyltransferase involved in cell wall biosynthesis
MKVLWFTNHVLPEFAESFGYNSSKLGGWMPALADGLVESNKVILGIATNIPGNSWTKKKINSKIYYSIPQAKRKVNYRNLPLYIIDNFRRAVAEFQPDIIHVHGTEYFHGLLTGRKYINLPAVISIQGIIDIYCQYFLGNLSIHDLIFKRSLRDWIRLDGLIEQKLWWEKRVKWEREIFINNNFFIGRTLWDKSYTNMANPLGVYYHCNEMLRTPFYSGNWKSNKFKPHTIYASSANYPLKGFHILLKAVLLLRKDFPDIEIRVPSKELYIKHHGVRYLLSGYRATGYIKYLTEYIKTKNLEKHIVALAPLEDWEVVRELEHAHVFVLPSFIENSPNSLSEAMIVGTPSVVSFTGGIPSMVKDGESALCFPLGDSVLLAHQIRRIFNDINLAYTLSLNGQKQAHTRHCRSDIIKRQLEIYTSILSTSKGTSNCEVM